ncbi:MAG: LysM peptidoglycan-binding domain-containing protein [Leadbetterella sp.]
MKISGIGFLVFLLIVNTVFAQQNKFLEHKVAPKETLYSLLKKYDCTQDRFQVLNPNFDSAEGLKIGQVIRFDKKSSNLAMGNQGKVIVVSPTVMPKPEIKNENSTVKVDTTKKPTGIDVNTLSDNQVHVVYTGETIFSLSKKYEIPINDFVVANNLSDNIIKQGDKLIIDKEIIKKQLEILAASKEPSLEMKKVGKLKTEEGLAQIIKTKSKSNKYMAMHKTIPVGTIVKITNMGNGESVTAKIIGNLNPKGRDENTLIKLSPLAYYELKPLDDKMRARVEYYLPKSK